MSRTLSYRDIAITVRSEIAAGVWKAGDPLPGRAELTQRFGVARGTIDHAILSLVQAGVLESVQGSGTYVRSAAAAGCIGVVCKDNIWRDHFPTDMLYSFYDMRTMSVEAVQRALEPLDGVLWTLPLDNVEPWILAMGARKPVLTMAMHVPGLPGVGYDLGNAMEQVTLRRMQQMPQGRPVFLRIPEFSERQRRAEEGFLAACRALGRHGDILTLPNDFEQRLARLREVLSPDATRPPLIFAESRRHTGSVLLWARLTGATWRHDAWYVDIENILHTYDFGVDASTITWDDLHLVEYACARMQELIAGKKMEPQFQTITPVFQERGT